MNAGNEDVLKKFELFEKLFRLIFRLQLSKTKGIVSLALKCYLTFDL